MARGASPTACNSDAALVHEEDHGVEEGRGCLPRKADDEMDLHEEGRAFEKVEEALERPRRAAAL